MLDEFDIPFMKINTEIESEISQLETEQDKLEFLDEYGLTEIISKRFVKKLYDMMGLVSFFTVGKDEVKAWSIKTGTSALKAAGKIHSDIERGFIRAEIIGSDKFFEFDGDMNKLKKEGLVRLEGKDYIVKDGEIINFRFNV
jgi:hypothetical protein